MRGVTGFVVLALSMAACRQTVVIDLSAVDAGGRDGDGGPTVLFRAADRSHPQSPKVMVVLDRSARMTGRFGDSTAAGHRARRASTSTRRATRRSSDSAMSDFPAR